MKFYRYKQLQRLTFFGYDDVLHDDPASFSKKSQQSTTAGVDNDTKILRFNINRLFQTHLSQNAKIVIEQLYLPATVAVRAGPITIRMNNLNTQSHDSQNNGFNKTLIYVTEFGDETFQNHSPEMLYNFSISQNFFQNGFVEFEIQYPDIDVLLDFFDRFYISLVVYDIDEQDLLLKDTPEVDFKNVGPQVNFHNGRIPK
jgi:hypothetical protein